MSLAQLFSGSNFRTTIQQYCARQGWKIADLNDARAILRFNMGSQRTQTCYVIKYDKTLEFSVPSMFIFDSYDQVPHYISTILLKRSSEKKIGFWCIEEIGGKQVYSCMHNAEQDLIDSNYFASVVRALINECDELETVILKMMR
ncbi:MAG: hypothetical protein IPO15_21765 [Anaerolineae bacterium]|uniref:hypothetical protein n=1 Tax=Candidatus Amarolinea dominans TaxID=3140696 RepID=UPI00313522AA|nr:hypothetical protein [Anaerolineae bacterium]